MRDVLRGHGRCRLSERGARRPHEEPLRVVGIDLVPRLRSWGEQMPGGGIYKGRRRGVVIGLYTVGRSGRPKLRQDCVAGRDPGSREGRADQPRPQSGHVRLLSEKPCDVRLVDPGIRNSGRNRQHAYGHTPW